MHCIFSKVWNYAASFNIYGSNFFTFFSSFYEIPTWSHCLYKLQVTMWFMFIPTLFLFFGICFCYIFKSLQQPLYPFLNPDNFLTNIEFVKPKILHKIFMFINKTIQNKTKHGILNYLPQIHCWGWLPNGKC